MKKDIYKSILAGMAIALGCWMYLAAPNTIVGAFLFSCGLLTVRLYKLNLFTGKIQFMVTNQYPWYFYLIVLLGNIIGVSLMALLAHNNASATIATAKLSQSIWEATAKGIGCGMLMSIATYDKSPLWMCFPCVMGFILGGFNHCIADAYYMIAAGAIGFPLLGTIIGNIFGGVIFSNLIELNT